MLQEPSDGQMFICSAVLLKSPYQQPPGERQEALPGQVLAPALFSHGS